MKTTARPQEVLDRVKYYCQENMLWRTGSEKINYTDVISLNLNSLEPTVSGPSRPQDKILVKDLKDSFQKLIKNEYDKVYKPVPNSAESNWLDEGGSSPDTTMVDQEHGIQLRSLPIQYNDQEFKLFDGSVVIAAITSCTNTSNPAVMVGAGLVARKAHQLGLQVKPWVKTSLAPGSKVVTNYLEKSGLQQDLEALNFYTVGYGCTSCIGNSGPLPDPIRRAIEEHQLNVSAVLSGNRNFEARVHPQVRMNFLASPMLVVVYALTGTVNIDLLSEPVGLDNTGQPVFMKDLWPTSEEINEIINASLSTTDFEDTYRVIYQGEEKWQQLEAPSEVDYQCPCLRTLSS
jgi:aconitate hydratase